MLVVAILCMERKVYVASFNTILQLHMPVYVSLRMVINQPKHVGDFII
jgi:hypothetical protein